VRGFEREVERAVGWERGEYLKEVAKKLWIVEVRVITLNDSTAAWKSVQTPSCRKLVGRKWGARVVETFLLVFHVWSVGVGRALT